MLGGNNNVPITTIVTPSIIKHHSLKLIYSGNVEDIITKPRV
jgi:hypothetical protein